MSGGYSNRFSKTEYPHVYDVCDEVVYRTEDGRVVIGYINDLNCTIPFPDYKIYEGDAIRIIPEQRIISKATPMARLLYV